MRLAHSPSNESYQTDWIFQEVILNREPNAIHKDSSRAEPLVLKRQIRVTAVLSWKLTDTRHNRLEKLRHFYSNIPNDLT